MIRSALRSWNERPIRVFRAAFIIAICVTAMLTVAQRAVADADLNNLVAYGPICKISVTPKTATVQVGTNHSVTAHLDIDLTHVPQSIQEGEQELPPAPVDPVIVDTLPCDLYGSADFVGLLVHFEIVSGPNKGLVGDAPLDELANAKFTWTSKAGGSDVVEASLPVMPEEECVGQLGSISSDCEPICLSSVAGEINPYPCFPYECVGLEFCAQSSVSGTTGIAANPGDIATTATASWLAPVVSTSTFKAPVTSTPQAALAALWRCVSRTFTITPRTSGGTVTSTALFIDGRLVESKNAVVPFKINARKYKAGRHRTRVLVWFDNGTVIAANSGFTRCRAARTAARRVAPQFTG